MALTEDRILEARSNFLLKREVIFLNHASHGPLMTPARAAYDNFLDSWQMTGHNHDIESFRILEDVRGKLASMVGCNPDHICLTPGTSYGFNVVSIGYPWKPGDNMIVSKCEFPAAVYPWKRIEHSGVEIRMAECDRGFIDEDRIMSMVDDNTRIICLGWVQFSNGFRNDLAGIGEFCRRRDILLCVDGIQGMGVIPIDLGALEVDLFTCGCQKWMLGPCGTGFFYLSPRAQEMLQPSLCGWLSVDWGVDFTNLMRYDLPFRNGARRYEIMTYPFQDFRALDASLDFLISFDAKDRWERVKNLTGSIIEAVESNSRLQLASSTEETRRSGILNLKARNSGRLFEFLTGQGIVVSHREGGVRVSPHFYNTSDEIEFFIEKLSEFEE